VGINRLDTAVNYRDHTAHTHLAATGRGLLDEFRISTKVGFFPASIPGHPNQHSLDPRQLLHALRRGAEDLGRIPDVVFLHNPERGLTNPSDPVSGEILAAACDTLDTAAGEGLCRAWGISTWNAAAVLSVLDNTPMGMIAAPAAVMVRAGLLVGDTELSAGQALGDRFGLPIPARFGMSPFGGDTRDDIWRKVDPRRFLEPGQTATRFAAALRIAFDLPVCGAVTVGTSRTDHLRELAAAPDLDTAQAQIKRYRELLSSARATTSAGSRSTPA
jgi:aryl-alcohol dehydrogenase-like predicted oxidoreductase